MFLHIMFSMGFLLFPRVLSLPCIDPDWSCPWHRAWHWPTWESCQTLCYTTSSFCTGDRIWNRNRCTGSCQPTKGYCIDSKFRTHKIFRLNHWPKLLIFRIQLQILGKKLEAKVEHFLFLRKKRRVLPKHWMHHFADNLLSNKLYFIMLIGVY